jgi:hypothetical protein
MQADGVEGQPFPTAPFLSDFEPVTMEGDTETIPEFQFPLGFHTLSLFLLAQYYDGNARIFYESFLFSGQPNPFSNSQLTDFGPILTAVLTHFRCSPDFSDKDFVTFLAGFYDRGNNGHEILKLPQLGQTPYAAWECPHGSERSVVHLIVQNRERDRPLLVHFSSFEGLLPAVTLTAGQPFVINSLISREYSTSDSVSAKFAAIRPRINAFKFGQFQVDWAIATSFGIVKLILCRPPQFFCISQNSSAVCDSPEEAFAGSHIVLACYRHTYFISRRKFGVRNSPSHPGPTDSDGLWCSVLNGSMETWRNERLPMIGHIIKCLQIPAFYFVHSGASNAVSGAASIFLDIPMNPALAAAIAAKHCHPGAQMSQFRVEFNDFAHFCFWVRALIRVFKAMVMGDVARVLMSLAGLFRGLPIRNARVIAFSVWICGEAIRIFHPQRGRTEEFYAGVVRIYRFIFGDQFDTIIGLERYDVPRPLRNQLVTFETCSRLFEVAPFKRDVRTIASVIVRLEKYFKRVVAVRKLTIPPESPRWKLDPIYLDFLTKVVIAPSVEL